MIPAREPRQHNERFLRALRRLPCLVCGVSGRTEAAHIRMTSAEWHEKTGARTGAGAGEKPHDRWALPLCAMHHREGPQAEHVIGTLAFWKLHKMDPHKIASELYAAFPNEKRMAAAIINARAGSIFEF
jgi:hypothetical protein